MSPTGESLPVRRAVVLAEQVSSEGGAALSLRLDEPYWPLVAFRIKGSADEIACEVVRLACGCEKLAGEEATESIAMYPENGAVTCIFVPRDRRKERAEGFGGNIGAFESGLGSLVFSDLHDVRRSKQAASVSRIAGRCCGRFAQSGEAL
jgi:hypothetical protein